MSAAGITPSRPLLNLSGWSRARRVVVVRRAVKDPLAAESQAAGKRAKRQKKLDFADAVPMKLWEYAVLVTNADYDLEAIGPTLSRSWRLREWL